MRLDANAIRTGCRGTQVDDGTPSVPRRARPFPAAIADGAPHRGLHPGSASVRRGGRARPDARRPSPTSTSAKRRDGRATGAGAGPKMAALLAAAAEPMPTGRHRQPRRARASSSSTAATRRAVEAAHLLKEHLDVTVLHRSPRPTLRRRAPPNFPSCEASMRGPRDTLAPSSSRWMTSRSPRPPRAGLRLRRAAQRARNRSATSSSTSPAARRCSPPPTCARAICAPIPGEPAAMLQGGAQGARSGRHVREAALHQPSTTISARIRARASSAAAAASIFARPGPSRPAGNHVAIDAADLRRLRPVRRRLSRPAPRPMPCRPPMR